MHSLRALNQDDLLETLTELYQKYRKIIQEGGVNDELASYKVTLEAVLNELNDRRTKQNPTTEDKRKDFEFKRINS